jgi:hypothetical protein
MRVGSVEYAVIAFPGNNFKGEIIPAIGELVDQGLVRVLDLVFVKKDATGTVQAIETSALAPDEAAPFSALASRDLGLLNDDDIADIAASLPAECSAGLIVWENVWSARFSEAVANADGILVANERIPAPVVKAALEYAGVDVD